MMSNLKEVQTKIISKNKIKPPFEKIIFSQKTKDEQINKNNAKEIIKTLGDM